MSKISFETVSVNDMMEILNGSTAVGMWVKTVVEFYKSGEAAVIVTCDDQRPDSVRASLGQAVKRSSYRNVIDCVMRGGVVYLFRKDMIKEVSK